MKTEQSSVVTGCGLPVFGSGAAQTSPFTCPPYFQSTQQTASCPVGYSGGPFTSPEGKFSSTISQADANNQAEVYLRSLQNAQCFFIPVPTVQNGNITVLASGPVNYQIIANHNPISYGATGLPLGLSVNTTTGVISGNIPATEPTTYTVELSSTNINGTGYGTLVITVPISSPVVTSQSLNQSVGLAVNYQIIATNSPISYGATGLPAGLNINTSSGVISGTIASTSSATYTIPISAANISGTGNGTLTLIMVPSITIASSTADAGGFIAVSIDGGAFVAQANNTTVTYHPSNQYAIRATIGGATYGVNANTMPTCRVTTSFNHNVTTAYSVVGSVSWNFGPSAGHFMTSDTLNVGGFDFDPGPLPPSPVFGNTYALNTTATGGGSLQTVGAAMLNNWNGSSLQVGSLVVEQIVSL